MEGASGVIENRIHKSILMPDPIFACPFPHLMPDPIFDLIFLQKDLKLAPFVPDTFSFSLTFEGLFSGHSSSW